MSVELRPAKPDDVPELGRICYEAFKDLYDRHGFPLDLPTVAFARQVIGMMVQSEQFYGVAAASEGQLIGSNFLTLWDAVAGVGPITVEPPVQGQDTGRALMQAVVDHARQHQREQVRLLQDAFNMASISLYASLGFEVRAACALMQPAPAREPDESIRPLTADDLPAAEELSRRIYKVSRRNETAFALEMGFSPAVRERDGRVVAYLIPGRFGHGVAETEDDALALARELARRLPNADAAFFCPLGEHVFFRKALAAGCRTVKLMNLMTLGPYEPPDEVWLPSILY